MRTTKPRRQVAAPSIDDAALGLLLEAVAPLAMQPDARAATRARVLAGAAVPVQLPASLTVTAGQGDWRPLWPGVRLKPLLIDRAARTLTALWRLEPGAQVPAHGHDSNEECLIVEGSIVLNDHSYGVGDYLFARAGSHHEPIHSPAGALLLVRGDLEGAVDRLLA